MITTLDDECLEFTTVTTSDGETVQVRIKSIDSNRLSAKNRPRAVKSSNAVVSTFFNSLLLYDRCASGNISVMNMWHEKITHC